MCQKNKKKLNRKNQHNTSKLAKKQNRGKRKMSFVVAIDGPAGAGKGTITELVGKQVGLVNIDTGATFRCVTLAMIKNKIKLEEEEKIKDLLASIHIDLKKEEGEEKVYLDGEDVTKQIREKQVNDLVSPVSTIKIVRDNLLLLQRKMAEGKDVIMEGRDIGTTVFPDAQVKIYLTATAEERARRRVEQNKEKGIETTYEEALANVKARDKMDSERKQAPLKQAEDAICIDSTQMNISEVAREIIKIIEQKRIENVYEVGLPSYLQHDIDQFIEGKKSNSSVLDCYFDELYGSINSAYYSDEITEDQANYLRHKYLFK